MKNYRIFIINPGSTSTKLSMFENNRCLFTEDTFHDSSVLLTFPTINDQLDYRMSVVHKFLADKGIDLTGVQLQNNTISGHKDTAVYECWPNYGSESMFQKSLSSLTRLLLPVRK